MTGTLTNQPTNSAVECQNINAEILKLFTDVLNLDVPSTSTDLIDTAILDSQKFVELLLHLEQRFDVRIEIDDFELENFRCIERIATLVSQRKVNVLGT